MGHRNLISITIWPLEKILNIPLTHNISVARVNFYNDIIDFSWFATAVDSNRTRLSRQIIRKVFRGSALGIDRPLSAERRPRRLLVARARDGRKKSKAVAGDTALVRSRRFVRSLRRHRRGRLRSRFPPYHRRSECDRICGFPRSFADRSWIGVVTVYNNHPKILQILYLQIE